MDMETGMQSFYCPPNVIFSTRNNAAATQFKWEWLDSSAPADADILNESGILWTNTDSTKYGDFKLVNELFDVRYSFANSMDNAKFNLCRGEVVNFGSQANGTPYQAAFYPQSQACDIFMTDYCTANPQDPVCVCFSDQLDLEIRLPGTALPVRCLGQNCAFGGYQTYDMAAQGCDVSLCEQVVNMYGEKLASTQETNIFCGYNAYQVYKDSLPQEEVQTLTEGAPEPEDDTVPFWVWIIVAVVAVAFAIYVGVRERG